MNAITFGSAGVQKGPEFVAISPGGTFAYVTYYNGYSAKTGNVAIINTATNKLASVINSGFDWPGGVAFSPSGTYAYVTNEAANNVVIINTATNMVMNAINSGFNEPIGVAFAANGTYAYVANYGSNNVVVINTTTNTVVNAVTSGFSLPYGVTTSTTSTTNGTIANVTFNITTTTIPVAALAPPDMCPSQNTYVYYPGDYNSSFVDYYQQANGAIEYNTSTSYVVDEQHNNVAQMLTVNGSNFSFNGRYYNFNDTGVSSYIKNGYLYSLLYANNKTSGISIINTSDYGLRGTILNGLSTFKNYSPVFITVGNDGTIYAVYNSTNTTSPSLIVSAISPTAAQKVISSNNNYALQSSDVRSVVLNSTNIGVVGNLADAVLYQNDTSGQNQGDYLYMLMGTKNISNPSPTLVVINFTGSDSSIYNIVNIYPEQPDGAIALTNDGQYAYFTAGNSLIGISTLPSQNSQIMDFIPVSNSTYNLTGIAMSSTGTGIYADDNNGDVFNINLQSGNATLLKTSGYKMIGKLALSTDNKQLYGYSTYNNTYNNAFVFIPVVMNASSGVVSRIKSLQQLSYEYVDFGGYVNLFFIGLNPQSDISLTCENQNNYYGLDINATYANYMGHIDNNYSIFETAYNYNSSKITGTTPPSEIGLFSTNPKNDWLYGVLRPTNSITGFFYTDGIYNKFLLTGVNTQTGQMLSQSVSNESPVAINGGFEGEYQQEAYPSTDGSTEYYFLQSNNGYGSNRYYYTTSPLYCPNVYNQPYLCEPTLGTAVQNFSGNNSGVFFKNPLIGLCTANGCFYDGQQFSAPPVMGYSFDSPALNISEINYTFSGPDSVSYYIMKTPSNMDSVSTLVNLKQAVDNYAQNYMGVDNPSANVSFGGEPPYPFIPVPGTIYPPEYSKVDYNIANIPGGSFFAGESGSTLYAFMPLDFYGSLYIAGNASSQASQAFFPFSTDFPIDPSGQLYPMANYTYQYFNNTANGMLRGYKNGEVSGVCYNYSNPGPSFGNKCTSQQLQNEYTNYTLYNTLANQWRSNVQTLANDYNNYYLPNNRGNLTPASYSINNMDQETTTPKNGSYSSGLTGYYELQINPSTGDISSMVKINMLTNQTVEAVSIDPYTGVGYMLTDTTPTSNYVYEFDSEDAQHNSTFALYSFSPSQPNNMNLLWKSSLINYEGLAGPMQFLPNNQIYLSGYFYNLTSNKMKAQLISAYNQYGSIVNSPCDGYPAFSTADNKFLYCDTPDGGFELSVYDITHNRTGSAAIDIAAPGYYYKSSWGATVGLTQNIASKT